MKTLHRVCLPAIVTTSLLPRCTAKKKPTLQQLQLLIFFSQETYSNLFFKTGAETFPKTGAVHLEQEIIQETNGKTTG